MALILYAEDDEIVGELVRKTLATDGHVVGLVKDGASALRSIVVKQPQLVILDCGIPEISGIEVLREIRLNSGFSDLPVIMLTGRQSEKDVSLAAYAGADGYIKKPFDPDYLLYVTDSLLRNGRGERHMAH